MKRTLTIGLLSCALAVTAVAQGGQQKPATPSKPAALPSVDQVLDRYVQAIGGKAVIEKQTSRVSKGSFELAAFGASGTAEVYEKAPNKTVAIVNIAGFGVIQEGFDGKTEGAGSAKWAPR